MAWFSKKADPISDRSRELSAEIAALEAQIRELDSQTQQSQESQENPRRLSPALPKGAAPHRIPEPSAPPSTEEPIFEDVDQDPLKARGEAAVAPEDFNELGAGKSDAP